MSNTVIKVENVGKLYRLGEIGTGTISHDINRWWARIRGKEDPFAKVGEMNDRTKKSDSDYVWSLKNINFEVKQGEVLGIIGRNGAGKSTLLKVLSKITTPTTGQIKVKGRIASLLEVGTGFHPDLTGRENIFLNGAILGMSKGEIKSKFDEIVDFSGVERYIDTPVKRYSSGMYVRLAFAVAAHLEPEILIVDEVLAVGDAEFQKKCLGKMKDVSVNGGRTVLFVSHNMAAVKSLCNTGLLLKNGNVSYAGEVQDTINEYLKSNNSTQSYKVDSVLAKPAQILELYSEKNEYTYKEDIVVFLTVKNDSAERGIRCNVVFFDMMDQMLFVEMLDMLPDTGVQKFKLTIPGGKLAPIRIKMAASMDIPGVKLIEIMKDALFIDIVNIDVAMSKHGDPNIGIILSEGKWNKIN